MGDSCPRCDKCGNDFFFCVCEVPHTSEPRAIVCGVCGDGDLDFIYMTDSPEEYLCEGCNFAAATMADFADSPNDSNPGYHLTNIVRGELGEPSKIYEEVDEFRDAIEQKASIMALVELSDLLGAIGAYLEKYHPSITMDDLAKMREITERAFINGRR